MDIACIYALLAAFSISYDTVIVCFTLFHAMGEGYYVAAVFIYITLPGTRPTVHHTDDNPFCWVAKTMARIANAVATPLFPILTPHFPYRYNHPTPHPPSSSCVASNSRRSTSLSMPSLQQTMRRIARSTGSAETPTRSRIRSVNTGRVRERRAASESRRRHMK